LRSTSSGGNDGIEVKVGSYGNVIRDNVIHDTTIGTRYPCIFVYGGGPGLNIVEGNAVWSCGEGSMQSRMRLCETISYSAQMSEFPLIPMCRLVR
jgi:hypothetical protein